jgi:hypothetical protein
MDDLDLEIMEYERLCELEALELEIEKAEAA